MYSLTVQRFLNLMRLLDVMSAEPAFQVRYLEWRNFPDPLAALGELFEDLQGYEGLIEDMKESGDLRDEEEAIFRRILSLADVIDEDPRSYTRAEVNNGETWREVRDAAMVLKLSLASLVQRNPEFFAG
ncbi:hypothetical protein ACFYO2_03225 [Streptomyces sp. NPDC006602]|uniref:hypothetical protein n=1 Tax=Streptomyces sp. NPDC006602 TaxID=3364751 RepID=UPI0036D0E595